jgi:acyl-coenzyme A thioesterase PaaI-like protein
VSDLDGAVQENSPARLEAAAALRQLGNALIDREVDDDLLRRITAATLELLPQIESGPARVHSLVSLGPDGFTSRRVNDASGLPDDAFPDCFVSGLANPMGMAAQLELEHDEAHLTVTLGNAFEGAPGRAHGGAVAALIDEVMGFALSVSGTMAFTGRLTLTYRAPTPVGVPLEGHARVAHRQGRKLTITAELHCGDTLLAEAEGLFIAVDAAHFLNQT